MNRTATALAAGAVLAASMTLTACSHQPPTATGTTAAPTTSSSAAGSARTSGEGGVIPVHLTRSLNTTVLAVVQTQCGGDVVATAQVSLSSGDTTDVQMPYSGSDCQVAVATTPTEGASYTTDEPRRIDALTGTVNQVAGDHADVSGSSAAVLVEVSSASGTTATLTDATGAVLGTARVGGGITTASFVTDKVGGGSVRASADNGGTVSSVTVLGGSR